MKGYTNHELKQLVDEYHQNMRTLKQLTQHPDILTENGTHTYYKLKSRQQTIQKTLNKYGVKI